MNKCNVIKDLLPLYADEVCSEDSREMVEEHLASCKDCKQELDDYCYNTGLPEVPTDVVFKKFKRKTEKKAALKVISIILLICISLFGVKNAIWIVKGKIPFDKHYTTFTRTSCLEADNPYSIDIGDFERVYINVNKPTYLNYDGQIHVYDGKNPTKEPCLSVTAYQNSSGDFSYNVFFDYYPDGDASIVYGYEIDENCTLVKPDIDHLVDISYKVYLYDDDGNELKTDEEKKEHVRKELEQDHAMDQKFYEENLEQIKIMMRVIDELFGAGSPKYEDIISSETTGYYSN